MGNNPAGLNKSKTEAELRDLVAVFIRCGRSVRAVGRETGMARQTVEGHLRRAAALGLVTDLAERPQTSPEYQGARDRMMQEYQNKKAKGDWRKPVLVTLPPVPFRLKLFGDPHLDDPGSDVGLFIEHMEELDDDAGIYGVCVGDFFNNWTKSLAHLWKGAGDPSNAWIVFEHQYSLSFCHNNFSCFEASRST